MSEDKWSGTHTWYSLAEVTKETPYAEIILRTFAEELGFKTFASFAAVMSRMGVNYYDILKASCRE